MSKVVSRKAVMSHFVPALIGTLIAEMKKRSEDKEGAKYLSFSMMDESNTRGREYIILGPSLAISARLNELKALLIYCHKHSMLSSLFIIV